MKTIVDAIIIENKEIFLVKKKNTWILPGGKKEIESDLECVIREISEELSGTKIKDITFYQEFRGITPHSKKQVTVRAYFAKINGNLELPSQEISDSKYIKDFKNYNISDITMNIIDSLLRDKYL